MYIEINELAGDPRAPRSPSVSKRHFLLHLHSLLPPHGTPEFSKTVAMMMMMVIIIIINSFHFCKTGPVAVRCRRK